MRLVLKASVSGTLLTYGILYAAVGAAGGWRYGEWGMTLGELLSAGKGEAIATTSTPRSNGRSAALAEVPEYEIAGTAFRVSFFFQSGRLESVALNTKGDPGAAAFDRVEAVLLSRYGRPTSRETDRIVWTSSNTTITFVRFPKTVLNVVFARADARSSKN